MQLLGPGWRVKACHSWQKVLLVIATVVCTAAFAHFMHKLQATVLKVSSRMHEAGQLKLDQSKHLQSMASFLDSLQTEYSLVVLTGCPISLEHNSTSTLRGVCGKRFATEMQMQFTRSNIQQEYTKVQLRVDAILQLVTARALEQSDVFRWWKSGRNQLLNLQGQLQNARVACSWALHLRGPADRSFDALEIDSCISQYFWLWEAAYRFLVKTVSPRTTAMLQFDAWLVVGPMRYTIDGVQAWAAVAGHDVQAVQGTTPTSVAALKGLSRYLQYLYSYFSIFLSISSLSPRWIQEQLETTGLASHETWLNRAMLLQDLYFQGGNAFLPPNWSQELQQGARIVSQFGQSCAERHDGLVREEMQKHEELHVQSFIPLTVLVFALIAALVWQFWMLLLSPPSQSDSQAARRIVSRYVHAQVEGPARAASAGLEWMQQSLPARQLNKPAFREPVLFLHMHTGVMTRWLARIQAATDERIILHKRSAASCDVGFMLCRVASQYRAISRANVQVDCDSAIPSPLFLPAMSLFQVLSSLVDAAAQRSEHSDVHITCRYLPPLVTLNLREWRLMASAGSGHPSQIKAMGAHSAQCLRRATGCQRNYKPSQGSLLFSIVDGGDTMPQSMLSAMSDGSAVPEQHAGAVSEVMSSARQIVLDTFGGNFMVSTRPEHEDGTFVLFTVALSTEDTQRIEAEGHRILAHAALKEGPGLISPSRVSRSAGQKHSFVIPHIGRIPMRWPCRKLYSTREDNLKPAVQQFYSMHHRRLMSTDTLSDALQVTSCVIVDFNPDTVQRLKRIAIDSGREVLVFDSGLHAIGAWQKRNTAMVDCDTLLMRVGLPRLSGPTVAHMLLQQRFNGKIILYHDPHSPVQPVNAKLDVLPEKWTDGDVARRLSRRNRTAGVLAQDRVILPGT